MIKFFKEYINLYAAFFGGGFLASVVFYINHEYGAGLASVAAAKQFVYTFFFGGMFARLCENLSLKLDQSVLAIINATLVCTLLAGSATYFVHSLKGTPEPFLSTLPTLLTSPPAFVVLAWWTQRNDRLAVEAVENASG